MVKPDRFPSNSMPSARRSTGRMTQRGLVPGAVKPRLLGDIFSSEPESAVLGTADSASLVIPDATSGSFLFTVSNTEGLTIVAIPDVAFTVNGNYWPNVTHGLGNCPVVVFNDWAGTDNVNVATRCMMRNNSGAPITVVTYIRWRIIANPGSTAGASS